MTKSGVTESAAPQLLDEQQAAEHIGMSRWFLRRARTGGRGPAYMKIGRTVRYTANDLDTWLDRRRIIPSAPSRAGQRA